MSPNSLEDTDQVRFPELWRLFKRLGSHMYIMMRYCQKDMQYAPLYIHSFWLRQPSRPLEAERLNARYTDPSQIAAIKDKLRYYRHKRALRQKDVAEKTGIHPATYCAYEQEDRKIPYPLDDLNKIAELFGVPLTDLLDHYNLFLYNGQGRQIQALRQKLDLTKKEFGELYGFHVHTITQWENDRIQISQSTWRKLFGNN